MDHISVSTTFFPGAALFNPGTGTGEEKSDLMVYTCDGVFFYCHQSVLRSQSSNDFGLLLPALATPSVAHSTPFFTTPASLWDSASPPNSNSNAPLSPTLLEAPRARSLPSQIDEPATIFVQEDSAVFNIVLHIVYNMSCERYAPTIQTISRALGCLQAYGLSAPKADHDVWAALLRQAPEDPFQAYALGAAHSMESFCTLASQYTLARPLTDLTEAVSLTAGPLYLRRIVFLHLGREAALQRVIRTPPAGHDLTESCTAAAQRVLRQGWLAAVADVLTGPQPQNVEAGALVSAFAHLATLQCQQCKQLVQDRISTMTQDWVRVKRTIW